jgi:hypothetical protein
MRSCWHGDAVPMLAFVESRLAVAQQLGLRVWRATALDVLIGAGFSPLLRTGQELVRTGPPH